MLVQFGLMFGGGVSVQLLNRMLVVVFRFLACGMDVVMRVFVRVGVLMSVGMLCPVSVRMLVCVDVGMDVRVRMLVLDWIRHGMILLKNR
jgi:hypothetical protein